MKRQHKKFAPVLSSELSLTQKKKWYKIALSWFTFENSPSELNGRNSDDYNISANCLDNFWIIESASIDSFAHISRSSIYRLKTDSQSLSFITQERRAHFVSFVSNMFCCTQKPMMMDDDDDNDGDDDVDRGGEEKEAENAISHILCASYQYRHAKLTCNKIARVRMIPYLVFHSSHIHRTCYLFDRFFSSSSSSSFNFPIWLSGSLFNSKSNRCKNK